MTRRYHGAAAVITPTDQERERGLAGSIIVTGPRGGWIGAVNLSHEGLTALAADIERVQAANTVRRLAECADDLGVRSTLLRQTDCYCGQRIGQPMCAPCENVVLASRRQAAGSR